MDFKDISWINSKMLYVVTYFKIATCAYVHTFRDVNMHCEVLCIVYYWVRSLSCAWKSWFSENRTTVKTEL